jgi:hypothetical protein
VDTPTCSLLFLAVWCGQAMQPLHICFCEMTCS